MINWSQTLRSWLSWKFPAQTRHVDEASPIPELFIDQLTVEAFYALLEDADLHDVFEEFIVPAKPHD